MQRFFIGGGKRFKDKKSIAIASTDSFNARLHWNSVQTGNIHLQMNTISTYHQGLKHKPLPTDDKPQKSQTIHPNPPRRRKTKLSKLITLSTHDASKQPTHNSRKRPIHNSHKRKKT
eukprot:211473_1